MSDPADDDAARADAAMQDAATTTDNSDGAPPMVTDAMIRAMSAVTLSKHSGAEIAGSYELIERLMLHLPRRDLVLSQLINKAFKDAFDRSERVKTIFRMKLPAERETVYLNTRPQGPFRVIRLNRPLHRVVQIELLSFDQQLHMSDAGAQSSWRQEPIWLPKTSNSPPDFIKAWNVTLTEMHG